MMTNKGCDITVEGHEIIFPGPPPKVRFGSTMTMSKTTTAEQEKMTERHLAFGLLHGTWSGIDGIDDGGDRKRRITMPPPTEKPPSPPTDPTNNDHDNAILTGKTYLHVSLPGDDRKTFNSVAASCCRGDCHCSQPGDDRKTFNPVAASCCRGEYSEADQHLAIANYCKFKEIQASDELLHEIERSSLGIQGWADANVVDWPESIGYDRWEMAIDAAHDCMMEAEMLRGEWEALDQDRAETTALLNPVGGLSMPGTAPSSDSWNLPEVEANNTGPSSRHEHCAPKGGCVSFHEPNSAKQRPSRQTQRESAIAEMHAMIQTAKQTQRESAVAELHAMVGEDKISMLRGIGLLEELESKLLPVTYDDDDDYALPLQDWIDSEIELTLDSGCCEHVIDIGEIRGYVNYVTESSGSKRGQNFIVGNGAKVSNDGQCLLNLEQDGLAIQSTFQIAGITRPLMSVGRVCDQGLRCNFDDKEALVLDKSGSVVCRFERRGGLYVARLKLKSPELFARPAQ